MKNLTEYQHVFQQEDFLAKLSHLDIFQPKIDDQLSLLESSQPKYPIHFEDRIGMSYFNSSKKEFTNEIPPNLFGRYIRGDINFYQTESENIDFTVKMALLTTYGSIFKNKVKHHLARSNLEHLLIHNKDKFEDFSREQYLFLIKLEKIFNIPSGQLTQFVPNEKQLEQEIKESYSVQGLSNLLDVKGFMIKTSTYQKKGRKKDNLTFDLFDTEPEEKPNNQWLDIHDVFKHFDDLMDKGDLRLSKLGIKLIQEHDPIEQLKVFQNILDNVKPEIKPYHNEMILLAVNAVLEINPELQIDTYLDKMTPPELKQAAKTALNAKLFEEPLVFDDYKHAPALTYFNHVLDNNHANVRMLAVINNKKNKDFLFDTFGIAPTGSGLNVMTDYFTQEQPFVDTQFEQSFSKTIGSRVLTAQGSHCFNQLKEEDWQKLLDVVIQFNWEQYSRHAKDEFQSILIAASARNPYMTELLVEALPEMIDTQAEKSKIIIQKIAETAIADNKPSSVNAVLNVLRTELITDKEDSIIDKHFAQTIFNQIYGKPKAFLSQLDIQADDIATFGLTIPKKVQQHLNIQPEEPKQPYTASGLKP